MNLDLIKLDKNRKKRSWKFWVSFWIIAIFFLIAWWLFLQYKNHGIVGLMGIAKPVVNVLPVDSQQKEELNTLLEVLPMITEDNQEKTFLILFQNNLELRPGGGFIGSFGIVKTKGEKIISVETHDTNIVDDRISSGISMPYPMEEMLNVKNWELRDSNWSPDFEENAKKAEYFYHLEQGTEEFDGVIAISTDLLPTFLEITGPVKLADYPGEYNSENVITKLEYQVEKGYKEQDIEKGKRKYVIKELASEILKRAQNLSWDEKKKLILAVEKHLNKKDVMFYFKDPAIQAKFEELGWAGRVDDFDGDYLMMVDANLGALKTDAVIERSFEYTIDLSKEKPWANLKITYNNTARARDWMTSDYKDYLRVYVPEGSWLYDSKNIEVEKFGNELGKKYFGMIIFVPIDQSKTIELNYDLPEDFDVENYDLLIQKQSGIDGLPGKVTIIDQNGIERSYEVNIDNRWRLSELGE